LTFDHLGALPLFCALPLRHRCALCDDFATHVPESRIFSHFSMFFVVDDYRDLSSQRPKMHKLHGPQKHHGNLVFNLPNPGVVWSKFRPARMPSAFNHRD